MQNLLETLQTGGKLWVSSCFSEQFLSLLTVRVPRKIWDLASGRLGFEFQPSHLQGLWASYLTSWFLKGLVFLSTSLSSAQFRITFLIRTLYSGKSRPLWGHFPKTAQGSSQSAITNLTEGSTANGSSERKLIKELFNKLMSGWIKERVWTDERNTGKTKRI